MSSVETNGINGVRASNGDAGEVRPPTGPDDTFDPGLLAYSARRSTEWPYVDDLDLDALIVGAGFAGTFMLKELRDLGLSAVVYEAGDSFGGVWRANRYPGAKVDSEVPEYEFSWPEIWKKWNWKTNYPDFKELREYFAFVDKELNLSKDCAFNTVVVGAEFDKTIDKWIVRTADGRTAKCKYLIVAAGFAARRYTPPWPGVEKFKGVIHHSALWPEEDVEVKGKRCAVVGTGASGVQIIQTWGSKARELTVFQRSPNLALPMHRRSLTVEEQELKKALYPYLFRLRERTFSGYHDDICERGCFEDTPEEREEYLQSIWDKGGFRYTLSQYKDALIDPAANRETYNFWARQVRARIGDPRKRDILAPLEPPFPFSSKRPSLEQGYFETFNRESVDIVDVENNVISEFTETGIRLADGTHYEFDVIALATGFDVVTGGLTQMGLRSEHGTLLKDDWREGCSTYLGLTIPGYPNLFHMYGPHAPTLISNGPTTIEIQGRWITDTIRNLAREDPAVRYIVPSAQASAEWKAKNNAINNMMLFPTVKRSTFMGGSIPGKPFEQMNYVSGMPMYKFDIREALTGWKGFEVVRKQAQEGQKGEETSKAEALTDEVLKEVASEA